MVESISVADIEHEWNIAFVAEMQSVLNVGAVNLIAYGGDLLVEAAARTMGSSIHFKLYIESFLKLGATVLITIGYSNDELFHILEWSNKSIFDVDYNSRVIYSLALKKVTELFISINNNEEG